MSGVDLDAVIARLEVELHAVLVRERAMAKARTTQEMHHARGRWCGLKVALDLLEGREAP